VTIFAAAYASGLLLKFRAARHNDEHEENQARRVLPPVAKPPARFRPPRSRVTAPPEIRGAEAILMFALTSAVVIGIPLRLPGGRPGRAASTFGLPGGHSGVASFLHPLLPGVPVEITSPASSVKCRDVFDELWNAKNHLRCVRTLQSSPLMII